MSNNSFKLIFLIGLVFYGITSSFAQTYNSPFTLYGLGNIQHNDIARFQGMAGVNYGHRSVSSYSISNPASYSALKFTVFEAGLRTQWSEISLNGNKFNSMDASFGYLSLALPVSRKIPWSFALGLTPFSQKGYRLQYHFTEPFEKTEEFSGAGYYSKFFVGTSIEVIKNLSLGLNGSYFFGNATDTHTVSFNNDLNFYNLQKFTKTSIGDFVLDAGLQYIIPLKESKRLVIGAIANLPSNLNTNQETLAYTFNDTIKKESLKYDTHLPFGGGLGITYSNKELLTLGMDFHYRKWSDFDKQGQVYDTLQDQFEISLGGSFQFTEMGQGSSAEPYWKRIPYRFGIKYVKPNLIDANGSDYHQISASLGVGFRLKNQKGLPPQMLDLAFEGGEFNNNESAALREKYFLIHLGLSLNQLWFGQRKIN